MIELNLDQAKFVNGSGIPLGIIAAALAVGFITGGPAGLAIAAGGLLINEGTTKLQTLATTGEIT